MIETILTWYLAIGIIFAIFNLFIVFSQGFDEFGKENFGFKLSTTSKVWFVLYMVVLWPLQVFVILSRGKNE